MTYSLKVCVETEELFLDLVKQQLHELLQQFQIVLNVFDCSRFLPSVLVSACSTHLPLAQTKNNFDKIFFRFAILIIKVCAVDVNSSAFFQR